jgi:hypothetical protein
VTGGSPARRTRTGNGTGIGRRASELISAFLLAALTVAALTVAGLTVVGTGRADAAAQPQSDCTATAGVILAVDFAPWGGPLLRSCGSTPTTGYAQLNQGGWHTVGTVHDGPGFVCRISYGGYRHDVQYPTAAQQDCVLTPPASAYWAFWEAGPGATTWTYSQSGAANDHLTSGSVSLWIFGGTNLGGTAGSAVPTVSPQTLRTAAAGAKLTSGGPAIVNAPPVGASVAASHGSAWPTIGVAVIAVLVLTVAAVVPARRRRRLEQS